jgi:hypothetical protein
MKRHAEESKDILSLADSGTSESNVRSTRRTLESIHVAAPQIAIDVRDEPVMRTYCRLASPVTLSPKVSIPARSFLPSDCAEIYNCNNNQNQTRANICVLSFGGGLFGDYNTQTNELTNGDVQQLWRDYLHLPNLPTVKVVTVSGAQNAPHYNDSSTIENSIDVGFIGAQCPNSNITLIIGTSFLNVLDTARNLNPRPDYVSISWGFSERVAPLTYVNQINDMLKQMSESGITICAAAGDSGANDSQPVLSVDFPACSPYVTSCGGTSLLSQTNQYLPETTVETVWNDNPIFSATGGGISTIFPKPAYQNSVVSLQNVPMRFIPDVSSVASASTPVNFVVGGVLMGVGGTSIVSPFLTGYLASIEFHTFANGKTFNELLYQCPHSCFHDIVTGNNGAPSFAAGNGYDLCSGFGSIDGVVLSQQLRTLASGGTSQPVPPPVVPPITGFTMQPRNLVFSTHTPQQLHLVPASTQPLTWTTSNPAIATVDSEGLVTPVGVGTCFVGTNNAWAAVTVRKSAVSQLPSRPVISKLFVLPQLRVGTSLPLGVASIQPQSAIPTLIAWSSAQPNIASIDASTGLVTAHAPGIVTFLGVVRDSGKAQSMCSIMVVS